MRGSHLQYGNASFFLYAGAALSGSGRVGRQNHSFRARVDLQALQRILRVVVFRGDGQGVIVERDDRVSGAHVLDEVAARHVHRTGLLDRVSLIPTI